MFPCEKSSYCNYVKKSFIEKSNLSENVTEESQDESEKDFLQKKSLPTAQGKWPYAPARWNGQINVLVDMFTQLTEEIKVSGKPILETTDEDLLNFILTNFRDKYNREFSYYTIHTLLKKSRTDKRLHPQSPKRIDVSRNIKSKKQ